MTTGTVILPEPCVADAMVLDVAIPLWIIHPIFDSDLTPWDVSISIVLFQLKHLCRSPSRCTDMDNLVLIWSVVGGVVISIRLVDFCAFTTLRTDTGYMVSTLDRRSVRTGSFVAFLRYLVPFALSSATRWGTARIAGLSQLSASTIDWFEARWHALIAFPEPLALSLAACLSTVALVAAEGLVISTVYWRVGGILVHTLLGSRIEDTIRMTPFRRSRASDALGAGLGSSCCITLYRWFVVVVSAVTVNPLAVPGTLVSGISIGIAVTAGRGVMVSTTDGILILVIDAFLQCWIPHTITGTSRCGSSRKDVTLVA